MFALVLWIDTKESNVIKAENIRIGKDKVEEAKWGKKWYPVEVIKKSGE